MGKVVVCKYISGHVNSSAVGVGNELFLDIFLHKVILDIDVLWPGIIFSILGQ